MTTVVFEEEMACARALAILMKMGFDPCLFASTAEILFAAKYIYTVCESEVVLRFRATPAWVVGDSGPFIGLDGLDKLAYAFLLGDYLDLPWQTWSSQYTSVEVINKIPFLEHAYRERNYN